MSDVKLLMTAIAAGLLMIACDSAESGTPTLSPTFTVDSGNATPGATGMPDSSKCPVDAATCATAMPFIEAWERSDVDALMALAKPLATRCAVPRPSGLGGPYPLCDGATVDGEAREGYVWATGGHGGLTDAQGLREDLEYFAKSHPSVSTIGCELIPGETRCRGDFSLVFVPGDAERGMTAVLLPVVRDDGAGLIGVVPVLGATCAGNQTARDCPLVNGGTVPGMGLRYWGDESQRPSALPQWVFFRWEP